jgi:hypothetical protein
MVKSTKPGPLPMNSEAQVARDELDSLGQDPLLRRSGIAGLVVDEVAAVEVPPAELC